MLSWGRIRRALQPFVLKYWLDRRSKMPVKTSVEGFELDVFPSVFHPRYFGSSAILARFMASLPLKGKSLLDLGCGSGIVGLCAARAGACVTAVDVNPEAVRCAAANARRHESNIEVRVSDLFSSLGSARYDVIACNPPFLLGTPRSLAETAFYGGSDFGMIRRLAGQGRAHLSPDGAMYTVVSTDIDIEAIERIFREQNFNVARVLTTPWLLGESMVILCAR